MICQRCGCSIAEGKKFCTNCGAPVANQQEVSNQAPQKNYCSCGAELREGIKFCTGCGKQVGATGSGSARQSIQPKPPVNNSKPPVKTPKPPVQKNDDSKPFPTVLVIVLVIIAAAVVAFAAFWFMGGKDIIMEKFGVEDDNDKDSKKDKDDDEESDVIIVPDLEGLSLEDAVELIEDNNLTYKISYVESDTELQGFVIKQSPLAGKEAEEGDCITIYSVKIGTTPKVTETATPTPTPTPIPTATPTATPTPTPVPVTPVPTQVATPVPATPSNSDYILPNSDRVYLTRNDIKNLSQSELRLARNELYARHGRLFDSADLQAYFNSKSWYRGTIAPSNFSESYLNAYEIANRDLIVAYEREMGYN